MHRNLKASSDPKKLAIYKTACPKCTRVLYTSLLYLFVFPPVLSFPPPGCSSAFQVQGGT